MPFINQQHILISMPAVAAVVGDKIKTHCGFEKIVFFFLGKWKVEPTKLEGKNENMVIYLIFMLISNQGNIFPDDAQLFFIEHFPTCFFV